MAGGVIVDDFDNDGLLDIIASSYNVCEHLKYFHNNGDGTFSDRSEKAGFIDQTSAASTSARRTTTMTGAWTSW